MFCFLVLGVLGFSAFCRCELLDLKIVRVHKPEICSRFAKAGDYITINYNCSLNADFDELVDSTYERGHPLNFKLGKRDVIQGIEEGLFGACEGEVRQIFVPYRMAYGEKSVGSKIPEKADLVFLVHIVHVADGEKGINVFDTIDVNNDRKLTKDEVASYFKLESARMNITLTEHDVSDMVWEIFEIDDRNSDGLISRREFSGPIKKDLM